MKQLFKKNLICSTHSEKLIWNLNKKNKEILCFLGKYIDFIKTISKFKLNIYKYIFQGICMIVITFTFSYMY